MTTFSSREHRPTGTPLASAQDASRSTTEQPQHHQQVTTSEDEKEWRLHNETAHFGSNGGEKELKKLPESADSVTPAVPLRTITSSFAAAPYTGPFDADLRVTSSHEPKQSHNRPRSSRSSSLASTLRELPTNLQTASRVSTDADGNTVSTWTAGIESSVY